MIARMRRALRPVKKVVVEAKKRSNRAGINLNVGCGDKIIKGFVSLDVPSDWYHRKDKNFVPYNMVTDDLPYPDGAVDNIYLSHVIEHLPDDTIRRFFMDAARVLKRGGVLRIACPDAKFLWEVSKLDTEYWRWRDHWFNDEKYSINTKSPVTRSDYFVREVATPVCALYRNRKKVLHYDNSIFERDFDEVILELQDGLRFDINFPGDHINAWSFKKVERFGQEAGFSAIIESKRGASVAEIMQHSDFDQTCPNMSLYVDLVR